MSKYSGGLPIENPAGGGGPFDPLVTPVPPAPVTVLKVIVAGLDPLDGICGATRTLPPAGVLGPQVGSRAIVIVCCESGSVTCSSSIVALSTASWSGNEVPPM